MIVVLTTVGFLSGGFLTTVGTLTKERIASNKKKEIEEAILAVVPGTERSQKLYEEENLSVYEGIDNEGTILGYAVHASGVGFQDKITLMFGTDSSITRVRRLVILDQKETPGLGAKITDQGSFLKYWKDIDCTQPLSLHKPPAPSPENLGPSEVNTITGATISSESVLNTVNLSLNRLKKLKSESKLISEGQYAN